MRYKTVYKGTSLKFSLDIQCEGFSMFDNDFSVEVESPNGRIVIPKEKMIVTDDDKFLFTIETAKLGVGEYVATITAHVPDIDFPDGIRIEITKETLCSVMS